MAKHGFEENTIEIPLISMNNGKKCFGSIGLFILLNMFVFTMIQFDEQLFLEFSPNWP